MLEWRVLRSLVERIKTIEVRERAEQAGAVPRSTVALMPAASKPGRVWFATNGRKTGEGAGAGTGVLCYDDNVAWRRVDDGTTVLA